MVQNEKKNLPCFISQELHIMWLSFMVHMYKMISPGAFLFFFSNFQFFMLTNLLRKLMDWFLYNNGLRHERVEGVKGQKMVQNDKKCVCCDPYLMNCASWLSFIVHMCKMISTGAFFIFGVRVDKGHKMVQNDKKSCLLCSISQEPYFIWLSFMAHFCKMIISLGVFFIFWKILIFWVHKGGKRVNKKWQRILSVTIHISGTMHTIMMHMCKMPTSLGRFFF